MKKYSKNRSADLNLFLHFYFRFCDTIKRHILQFSISVRNGSTIFFNFPDAESDPNRAPPCDLKTCVLPDCFCSEDGTSIPGDLPVKDVPMMITITFDDAINNNNIELYKEIFNGNRKNPNGCDIKATYFVSHKYTNYSAVQETFRKGHEIAVHSIT